MPLDFELTHFIKETQLQHGLRAEDYGRYHHYLTNRLATLRQQLHLSNEKKKFLNKEVTKQNATDTRHLMLLALYAERCWSAAESQQEKIQAAKESQGEGSKPSGGVPPHDQYRKRLNKAVKWASKLTAVAQAVAAPRLQMECRAYELEVRGRAAAAHGALKEAKDHFQQSRQVYAEVSAQVDDAHFSVLSMKVSELDDRVIYCMQRLGEDVKSYKPAALQHRSVVSEEAGEAQTTRTVLPWNGRELTVTNIKVKDALREARSVPVHSVEAKILEGSGVVTVGQMNKVLDLMDRRVNYYNDALAHARQDLRGAAEGTALQTQLQLLVHYFLFQVASETLSRNLFLAEVHSRRFHATEASLQSSAAPSAGAKGRKGEIAPSLYASPLEVVRLYEAASESVGEMELLPGVSGRADVEAHAAVCRAGKLLYLGEAWRVIGDLAKAKSCYQAALSVLQEEGPTSEEGKKLRDRNEQSLFVLTAMEQASTAYNKQSAPPAYLVEATAEEVGVATNVMRFPPDFQAVPFKPVFVDIASTFIDYPE